MSGPLFEVFGQCRTQEVIEQFDIQGPLAAVSEAQRCRVEPRLDTRSDEESSSLPAV